MNETAKRPGTEELQVAYSYWLGQMTHLSERIAFKFKQQFPTFESWEALSSADREKAARSSLGDDYNKVLTVNFDSAIEKALNDVESHKSRGIRILRLHGPLYPNLLETIPDPPLVLFVKGAIDSLAKNANVAIIGTRDATPVGEKVAGRIAKRLGEHHWCIVSGLAKGIDAAAHRGALEAKAKTIAVMATPLDKVYPAENRELADQILEGGGCWVSEMALWKKPHRGSFVQRDRIQSGLSVAVIPVQTDVEGGTMHTVRYAEQQKRLLLCPRPMDQESSLKQYAGIKQLIATHRAKAFASDQYGEVLDSLSKSLHVLLGAGFSQRSHVTVTDVDKDHASNGVEGKEKSDEELLKPKEAHGKLSDRVQSGFDFVAELHGGKSSTSKRKSKKSIETQIEILRRLISEFDQVTNADASRFSNAKAFKSWLESKISTLNKDQ